VQLDLYTQIILSVLSVYQSIHKPINSIWNKDDLPEEWKASIIAPIYKMGDEKHFIN
jgi:hypothetical protein